MFVFGQTEPTPGPLPPHLPLKLEAGPQDTCVPIRRGPAAFGADWNVRQMGRGVRVSVCVVCVCACLRVRVYGMCTRVCVHVCGMCTRVCGMCASACVCVGARVRVAGTHGRGEAASGSHAGPTGRRGAVTVNSKPCRLHSPESVPFAAKRENVSLSSDPQASGAPSGVGVAGTPKLQAEEDSG